MPTLHVCPLSRLPDTVFATEASHLLTLVTVGMPVERPASIPPENHARIGVSDIAAPQAGHVLPGDEHVAALLARFTGAISLSSLERGEMSEGVRAVIVDRTGILSALYRVGAIAYVGGGFGDGVHSVLEPAAYGVPVVCGAAIGRSRDASEMAALGGLTVAATPGDVAPTLAALLDDRDGMEELGGAARRFVEERIGATGRIIGSLRHRGLLPPAGLSAVERTEPGG